MVLFSFAKWWQVERTLEKELEAIMIETSPDPDELQDLTLLLRNVEEMVSEGQIEQVDELLGQQLPASRLILLSRLSRDARRALFLGLEAEKAADYLHDIPEIQALGILEKLEPEKAANILEELPKDEQADLVGELSVETQESILSEMDEEVAEEVRELIDFDDDEAGGMMIVEYVSVPVHWSVGDVTSKLQQESGVFSDYDVQYIYVVKNEKESSNATGQLVGVLRLRDLVMSPADRQIEEVMIPKPLVAGIHDELKDLHQFFVEHQFLGVPVTDDSGQLVGVLRRSDVEERMADRYAEDYLKSQGIVDEELRTMPLGLRSRRRLSWLSINIVLNIIAASVIAFYQQTLEQVIALAVFLPIISDMCGCSGNQSVAVSMRELSLGLVRPAEVWRVWFKDFGVALINGFCLGVLIGTVAYLWQGNIFLSGVVGIAMMANTLIAVSLGGVLPLVMRLLKMDPALASGPILTTVTDMCGFFLVLSLASLCLDWLV